MKSHSSIQKPQVNCSNAWQQLWAQSIICYISASKSGKSPSSLWLISMTTQITKQLVKSTKGVVNPCEPFVMNGYQQIALKGTSDVLLCRSENSSVFSTRLVGLHSVFWTWVRVCCRSQWWWKPLWSCGGQNWRGLDLLVWTTETYYKFIRKLTYLLNFYSKFLLRKKI